MIHGVKLTDLRLDPSGIAFATACCFFSHSKPAYIDKFIADGQDFRRDHSERP
jgi:hypothetical protein